MAARLKEQANSPIIHGFTRVCQANRLITKLNVEREISGSNLNVEGEISTKPVKLPHHPRKWEAENHKPGANNQLNSIPDSKYSRVGEMLKHD